MLTFENTCPDGPLPPAGTGLASIRAAAEKYRGAVLTEKAGGRFSLNVLLNTGITSTTGGKIPQKTQGGGPNGPPL